MALDELPDKAPQVEFNIDTVTVDELSALQKRL
jgi:hypothetical protein